MPSHRVRANSGTRPCLGWADAARDSRLTQTQPDTGPQADRRLGSFIVMSNTYTVQRSVTLDASPDQVYEHIVDFRKWADWSPWDDMDPAMSKTYSGADAGVGAKYSWSGNRKVGQGRMEIKAATEASNVKIALEFLKPFKARNKTEFILRPTGSGTEVTWAMTGRTTLLTRIMGIFKSMDSMVGPDFERGLTNLKRVTDRD